MIKPKPPNRKEREEANESFPVETKTFDEIMSRIVRVPPPPKPKK